MLCRMVKVVQKHTKTLEFVYNMKGLKEYIIEAAEEYVYAVKDTTGAILNVFQTKEEAVADTAMWPKESKVVVVKVKRSDVED